MCVIYNRHKYTHSHLGADEQHGRDGRLAVHSTEFSQHIVAQKEQRHRRERIGCNSKQQLKQLASAALNSWHQLR